MQLALTADETTLLGLVGPRTFLRGREYARNGAVLHASGDNEWISGTVAGSASSPYTARVRPERDGHGTLTGALTSCTCPVRVLCKHAVAVLLQWLASPPPAAPSPPAGSWARVLEPLLPQSPTAALPTATPKLGLQFDLTPPTPPAGTRGVRSPGRLAIRPVVPGATGRWIRGGVSWSSVGYGYAVAGADRSHRRLLVELLAILEARASTVNVTGYGSGAAYLEKGFTPRVWDLLHEAQEAGLPLVNASVKAGPVTLASHPAEVCLDLSRAERGMQLQPQLVHGGRPVPRADYLLLGQPAHALARWTAASTTDPRHARLTLVRLRTPVGDDVRTLLDEEALHVPLEEEERFHAEFYPRLRDRLRLHSSDGSVDLPEPGPADLHLEVRHLPDHRTTMEWHWRRRIGATEQRLPLWPVPHEPDRDADRPEDTVVAVESLLHDAAELSPLLSPTPDGPRLAASATLDGVTTVRFVVDVLPRLDALAGVTVTEVGAAAEYRQLDGDPEIAVSEVATGEGRDWFDLAVTVTVDGEQVPFDQLFVALAAGQEQLLLPSGSWISLDREEYRALAALIAESRSLYDAEDGTLRVNRFHAGVWEELEQLGVVDAQAAAWRRTVQELSRADTSVALPPPSLLATLRPYQLHGFAWLAFLYDHGLGGILADEMGLGKTVQALALMCRVREQDPHGAPFLVVAPTSVVPNWAAECRRFAPHLRVVTVNETESRRGVSVAALAADADVVVTSYTLLRLEHDGYRSREWSGLLIDEAQFAKNRGSRVYECLRTVPTPFKVAITGTPLENNLMELWALLSITAPGLFPHPDRFERHYRTPIEKGGDQELLGQLRRRIRPLMLRRTKDVVAADLPPKQEQIIELELNPRHRRVYQMYLQRERQKVLGLLGDFNRHRFEIFRSLTLLRQASLDVSLVDDVHAGIPSTKLDVLMEQVAEVVAEGRRTLVFSQFTRFLDRARDRLRDGGIEHCYLDGSLRGAARAGVLEAFRTGTAPVFLISLRAGGFGLTLTEADHCILLDPWWNPAVEAQAVDRVHRIGQTRHVMVYRLVAKDTIEEKVMALKASKAALFSSVLDGAGAGGAGLSESDVRGLLE